MKPETRRALFFGVGALAGLASHGQIMHDAAVVSSYLLLKHGTPRADELHIVLVALALLGSALLVISSWWRSIYRQRAAPLVTAALTGVATYVVLVAVVQERFEVAWLAPVLIALVLFAGIDSAWAMRREISATRKV